MHDAVPRGDDVDVIEGVLAPVDEVEAVRVAPLFHGAILLESPLLKAGMLYGQGVVDDELRRYHGIHRGGVPATLGDGVPKPGQIHQRRLPQNVVAHHPRGIPREVEIALPLNQLQEAGVEAFRIAPAHQLLREHPGRVGQGGVGAGLQRLNGGTGVVEIEVKAGKGGAVTIIHGSGNLPWPLGARSLAPRPRPSQR